MLACTWSRSPMAACMRLPPRPRFAHRTSASGALPRAGGHAHGVPRLARGSLQLDACRWLLAETPGGATAAKASHVRTGQVRPRHFFTETQVDAFVNAVLSDLMARIRTGQHRFGRHDSDMRSTGRNGGRDPADRRAGCPQTASSVTGLAVPAWSAWGTPEAAAPQDARRLCC